MRTNIKFTVGLFFGGIFLSAILCDVLKDYEDCGSSGTIKTVEIIPCPTHPCLLKKGTNVGIKMTFLPKQPVENLNILMYGILGPAEIKFDGVKPNACDYILDESGTTLCPITNITEPITYNNTFEIKPAYPKIPIGIKFEIKDKVNPQPVTCIKFSARITS